MRRKVGERGVEDLRIKTERAELKGVKAHRERWEKGKKTPQDSKECLGQKKSLQKTYKSCTRNQADVSKKGNGGERRGGMLWGGGQGLMKRGNNGPSKKNIFLAKRGRKVPVFENLRGKGETRFVKEKKEGLNLTTARGGEDLSSS